MMSEISVQEKKKKAQAGNEWSNILPESSQAKKKPPPPSYPLLVPCRAVPCRAHIIQTCLVLSQLQRHDLGERLQRGLGRTVGSEAGKSDLGGDAGQIDDRPSASFLHHPPGNHLLVTRCRTVMCTTQTQKRLGFRCTLFFSADSVEHTAVNTKQSADRLSSSFFIESIIGCFYASIRCSQRCNAWQEWKP